MSEVFVGRQPIYDRQLGVYAYELLFRSGEANNSGGAVSADGATSQTIVNTFLEIGLEKIVGSRFAAINLTESFFLEEDKLPISPKQVILEVLEDIPVTNDLIQAVKRLHSQGFIIALDDYIYNPSHKPLIEMCQLIKIDIMALSREQLAEHVKQLKPFGKKLLAEKVETLDEFDFCMDLGFDYFQGYFLSKPRIVKSSTLPQNKLAIMNILALLQDVDSEIEDIEEAITSDVAMSYKILKLMNSAFFNFSNKIESIKQALLLLGRKKLSSWASMTAMSKLDEQPSEMIHIAMIRAKMCELIAEAANLNPPENYFTAGLFSALDILMQHSLEALVKPLPISDELRDAVINKEGLMGEAILCALAYEQSDWENVKFQNLSKDEINIANIEAVTWGNMVMDMI